MANLDITNIDNACVEREGGKFRDETLTFAAADTFAKGTILARRAVAIAVVASAVTGVAGPAVPLVGAYVLTVVTAVTHGGVWKLVDPNGSVVAGNLIMTAGAGLATVFEAGGLQFTITDGSTDFAAGDTATLTVAADGKLVPYNPATGAGGEQYPVAVLTYEVTKASSGDAPIRALVAGEVNKTRLVIDAGTTITNAHLDALRDIGIVPINVQQLGSLDNQ
jgi:hypothetical protein